MIRGRYSRSSQSQGQKKDEKGQRGRHRGDKRQGGRTQAGEMTRGMFGGVLEAICRPLS